MEYIKHILAVTCIALICSCTTNAPVNENIAAKLIKNIKFDVKYYESDLSEISTTKDKDIAISFPPIRGNFAGGALLQHAPVLHLNESEVVDIPVQDFAEFFNIFSASVDETSTVSNLDISPKDTKIVRLGTKVTLQNNDTTLGETAFVNNKTSQNVILVYFDRACKIKGNYNMGGEVILIDISIPEPGAYWLNAQKVDSKTFCFRTAKDNDSISFAIFPNGM